MKKCSRRSSPGRTGLRPQVNPLRQAEDAVLLDSTRMTLEEVVEAITGMVKGAQA